MFLHQYPYPYPYQIKESTSDFLPKRPTRNLNIPSHRDQINLSNQTLTTTGLPQFENFTRLCVCFTRHSRWSFSWNQSTDVHVCGNYTWACVLHSYVHTWIIKIAILIFTTQLPTQGLRFYYGQKHHHLAFDEHEQPYLLIHRLHFSYPSVGTKRWYKMNRSIRASSERPYLE